MNFFHWILLYFPHYNFLLKMFSAQVFNSTEQHCGVADLARCSAVSMECQPACQMVCALQEVKSTVSCINRPQTHKYTNACQSL